MIPTHKLVDEKLTKKSDESGTLCNKVVLPKVLVSGLIASWTYVCKNTLTCIITSNMHEHKDFTGLPMYAQNPRAIGPIEGCRLSYIHYSN